MAFEREKKIPAETRYMIWLWNLDSFMHLNHKPFTVGGAQVLALDTLGVPFHACRF